MGDKVPAKRSFASDRARREVDQKVLGFVKGYTSTHGYGPSLREITEGLGLSCVAVSHRAVSRLKARGKLVRGKKAARGVGAPAPGSGPLPVVCQRAALRPDELAVFVFVRSFIRDKGFGPSTRDVVKACNLSCTNMATRHIDALADVGLLKRAPGVPRGVALVGDVSSGVRASCGRPKKARKEAAIEQA